MKIVKMAVLIEGVVNDELVEVAGTDELFGVDVMVEGLITWLNGDICLLSVLIKLKWAERINLPASVNSLLSTCTNEGCDSVYIWQVISSAEGVLMYRKNEFVAESVLTEKRVADILGVAVSTIKDYRKRGLLRSYRPVKAVYIFYADLVEFIVNNENTRILKGRVSNDEE